ncbi:hypothetical protein [Legionella spiritensis]|uniref:Periplasmic protein n=1 Tax=Legionella spiritensis TaxID=452 RepID=A0A0W0ZAP8_LEGSP|nr:hypothetical protein [Legionella spiritensis]KTD66204.1 periplasmic protein [Legionella spiritensis]SNV35226.1 periplasmic protein [Legionella spiritensis]VEG89731.1 periplasmic protein [Legionella spiritensis]
MNRHLLALFSGLAFSAPLYAFPCFMTLVKDSCWLNYNVKVVVQDAVANKEVLTITVPKGKKWARERFECQPAQKFMYFASFTPTIWENQEDLVYRAKRYWFMPGSIGEGDTAWNIPICYARDFAGTPFPPDATGNCVCDFSDIPEVKPQS